MIIFLLFIGALATSLNVIIDKRIVSKARMDYRAYAGVSWIFYFLCVFAIFVCTSDFSNLHYSFALKPLFFLFMTMVSGGTLGVMLYRTMHKEKLNEIESFRLLQIIPVVLVTGLLFQSERNWTLIVLAIIASLALAVSHFEHHHIRIMKKSWQYLLLGFLFEPLHAISAKIVLETWDPVLMLTVRVGLLTVLFVFLFYKQMKKINTRYFPAMFFSNACTAIAMAVLYYSYKNVGVVYTVLFFSLQHMLVYSASILFFKERLVPKKALAFLVMLICVSVAEFLQR